MALILDEQTNFKHFCKICKKGFSCGRALGGHMRAHGFGDEGGNMDDDYQESDWEDKLSDSLPPSNKRMYALRTNPNRLKSCRACENCGKEFMSWKSFLEHGKCTSEDAESLVSSPGSDGDDGMNRRNFGWSKSKRSFRAKVDIGNFNFNSNSPSSEEEDLANCLMMLSNAVVEPLVAPAEPEESCASASRDEERRNPVGFIAPISYRLPVDNNKGKGVGKGLFECKACKKVFNSHQALGGHRASHKKVKGCYAARLDQLDDSLADDDVITHEELLGKPNSSFQFKHGSNTATLASSSKRKSKVHECSICHRVFSSGQALGGHKRCHWITSNAPDTSTLARFQQFQEHVVQMNQVPKFDNSESLDLKLDLNFPAPAEDLRRNVTTEIYLRSWVGGKKEKVENSQRHHHQFHEIEIDDEAEGKNNNSTSLQIVDDEANSKVKLTKLSGLKEMNISGSSSPWLQVGIGSTTDVGADP